MTIPGTNLTIPLSALTGNQPMLIPGSNISLGGVQIPVGQGCTLQVGAGGAGDKSDGAKDAKATGAAPSIPTQPGRCGHNGGENFPRLTLLTCIFTFVEHVDSSHSFFLCFCSPKRTAAHYRLKVLSATNSYPCLSYLFGIYASFAWCFTKFTTHYHYSLPSLLRRCHALN